jgi:topoisomerase-4 subunit A
LQLVARFREAIEDADSQGNSGRRQALRRPTPLPAGGAASGASLGRSQSDAERADGGGAVAKGLGACGQGPRDRRGGLELQSRRRFSDQAQGRSNQSAVFLDSTGRTYSLPVAGLASARGYGEPLTGKLSPPDGARFVSVLLGNPEDLYLLATDAGYGFICAFDDMLSRNKAGKLVLTVPEGASILSPLPVINPATERLAAVSSGGRFLMFPVNDLPRLPKGKGNKILDLPDEEKLITLALAPPGKGFVLTAGKRELKLRQTDLETYSGDRGRRGKPLPRGFQRVERVSVAE